MKTNINNWLTATQSGHPVRKALVCNDGTTLSVQANSHHYCSPRVDLSDYYSEVEVWRVTAEVPDTWLEYGDTENNPFAYIPVELVEEFVDYHGGIKQ